jgi:YihY family inner membrane protein
MPGRAKPMGHTLDVNDAAATGDAPAEPGRIERLVDALDERQRRHRAIAFPYAVIKRFGEDRGTEYGALLAYYGFFSLLALLLVVTTVMATVLADHPDLRQQVVDAITNRVPVTGDAVATNVGALNRSGIALLLGVLLLLWSGLGVVNTAQSAFNTMWAVPRHQWPNLWVRALRSLGVLGVVGVALLVATGVGPALALLGRGWVQLLAAGLVTIAVNTTALVICFELLVASRIGLRRLLPGAFGGGLAMFALQFLGTYYMAIVVARAGAFYGTFAAAIGLLVWIGLQARIVLMANEINVVVAKELWPRSLTGRQLGPADRRALDDAVARESMSESLSVTTEVQLD